jgi:hypothetical protein
MVKINLPQLRQPELPSVNSTVVDTFYRPQVRPLNPALRDLSESLSGVVPSLRKYKLLKEEETKIEGQDKADADFAKNKDAFKNLVKEGTIPEGANPYYINQLAKNQLKQDAREFKERLFDKWNQENVWRSDNPLQFDKFYKSFSEEYYNEKKLGSYADATIAEGFIPDANAAYNELAQRNREKRIEEIENTQKDLLSKETFSLLDDALSIDNDALDQALADVSNAANLDEQDKRTLYAALGLQQTLDNLVDPKQGVGMNPRIANRIVVDTVISYAELMKDEEFIDVLANIVTDKNSGARLADTDYAFEKVNSALARIEQAQESDYLFQENKKEKRRQEKRRTIQNNLYDYFLNNPDKATDLGDYYSQLSLAGVELDAQNRQDIFDLQQAYINSQSTELVITDIKIYRDLLVDINTNPTDENIYGRLIEALNEGKIDSATFNTLYDAYKTGSDPNNIEYFRDPLWSFELNSLATVIPKNPAGDLLNTGDEEILNKAEITLTKKAYKLLKEFNTLDQYQNKTPSELETLFFDVIEKEANRIKNLMRSTDASFEGELIPEAQNTINAITNPL